MRRFMLGVLTFSIALHAFGAGSITLPSTKIASLHSDKDGVVYVYIADVSTRSAAGNVTPSPQGSTFSTPSCASTRMNRYVFSTVTDGGKAMFANAMTAFASDRPVIVQGVGDCTLSGFPTDEVAWAIGTLTP